MSLTPNEAESKNHPFLAIKAGPSTADAVACIGGVAIAMDRGGRAQCVSYGVAYAASGGTTSAGAAGVSFARGGHASAGDGGCAVAHDAGDAECGAHGVAMCVSPGKSVGRLRGAIGSILMFHFHEGIVGAATSRSTVVGSVVDGIEVVANVWYTLDDNSRFVRAPRQ